MTKSHSAQVESHVVTPQLKQLKSENFDPTATILSVHAKPSASWTADRKRMMQGRKRRSCAIR